VFLLRDLSSGPKYTPRIRVSVGVLACKQFSILASRYGLYDEAFVSSLFVSLHTVRKHWLNLGRKQSKHTQDILAQIHHKHQRARIIARHSFRICICAFHSHRLAANQVMRNPQASINFPPFHLLGTVSVVPKPRSTHKPPAVYSIIPTPCDRPSMLWPWQWP